MSRNPYLSYYNAQAKTGQVGEGLHGFVAPRYQAGFGFKSILTSFMPFFKSAGKTLLDTGVGLGKDLIEGDLTKDNVLSNIRKRGVSAAQGLADDACEELKRRKQSGSGKKKKKKTSCMCIKGSKKSISTSQIEQLLSGKQLQKKKNKKKRKTKKTKKKWL